MILNNIFLLNLASGSSDLADCVNGDTPLTPPDEEDQQNLATTTKIINLERNNGKFPGLGSWEGKTRARNYFITEDPPQKGRILSGEVLADS